MVKVIKKDGRLEDFDIQKVYDAVRKSAERVGIVLTSLELGRISLVITMDLKGFNYIKVKDLHNIVENAIDEVVPKVAQSYREYRNYKLDFANMLDEVYQKECELTYHGDRENSNLDSSLVSTKRSISYGQLNKEFYKKFNLNDNELQAIKDGYIYIHDMSSRRDTFNCCIFDVANVLDGGFSMGALWYNEPKSLDVAFDVIGDVIMSATGQQYGGFTVPNVDKLLNKYAEMSYDKFYDKYVAQGYTWGEADEYAELDVLEEFEKGFQGWEYKFNTVASSRGDYPFITMTFGLGTEYWEMTASESLMKVRKGGQGKKGKKQPVTFPKLVFLYDEDLHGENCEFYKLFDQALDCSSIAIYPDYLSLTGDGYVPSMYKEYGEVVHPMGCRAFLSPWYRKGGFTPQDETDTPVFVGRFNIGVVSLNLPMIIMKACTELNDCDVFQVLDYYLEMIRGIHKKTYEYLGKIKASTNPLAYCEGGLYGGNLQPSDCIAPLLKSATASFGVTALNECEKLLSNSTLVSGGEYSLSLMKHITEKITQFKEEDGHLYAIYGTPAESLSGTQVQQFIKKYGIIHGVSDREYFSNSFHCHVTEDITPIEKQDLEGRFWDYFNGGKIQYVKYPIRYNKLAMKTLVERAMKKGFYEGINMSLSFCNECGCSDLGMDSCNTCGSDNLTKIERMNGYLSYSRLNGKTRLNDAKMVEISERKSM